MCGFRWLSRYGDSLRTGRSGDRMPVGVRFSALVQTGLGPTKPPIEWVTGLFLGGKAAGLGVDHPLLSSADVKERVQLYLYSSLYLHGLLSYACNTLLTEYYRYVLYMSSIINVSCQSRCSCSLLYRRKVSLYILQTGD